MQFDAEAAGSRGMQPGDGVVHMYRELGFFRWAAAEPAAAFALLDGRVWAEVLCARWVSKSADTKLATHVPCTASIICSPGPPAGELTPRASATARSASGFT